MRRIRCAPLVPTQFGYPVEPLASTAEAIGTFPETAVCVGLRLDLDDRLAVVAPLGLDDLFDLVHRHNPRRATVAEYERRLATRRLGCRPWT
jgi:hypothetical protein